MKLIPRHLIPKPFKLPRYVVGRPCPLCQQPILFVWQPHDDGSYHAVAIDPGGWKGETIYLPGLRLHAKHCDLGRRYRDTIMEVA